MIKHYGYILCLALMIKNISSALAQAPDFLSLRYDTLSEGKDVGDITLKLSQTEKGYLIVEHNHIKTSGWWGDIDITTVMFEAFRHGIGLIKADSKTVDGVTAYWSKINRHENYFLGEFTEFPKISSREIQQFFELSSVAKKKGVSTATEVFSLSKAIFSTCGDSTCTHSVKFAQGSFVTTLNDFPFFIQRNADKPLPRKIRILDSENLEIIHADISDRGVENVSIGTKEIQVRYLILSGSEFKPSHLWIRTDPASLPYIVRHTGESEDGKFEIILKPQQILEVADE